MPSTDAVDVAKSNKMVRRASDEQERERETVVAEAGCDLQFPLPPKSRTLAPKVPYCTVLYV